MRAAGFGKGEDVRKQLASDGRERRTAPIDVALHFSVG